MKKYIYYICQRINEVSLLLDLILNLIRGMKNPCYVHASNLIVNRVFFMCIGECMLNYCLVCCMKRFDFLV
jgi:hypothetical protein